MKQWKEELCLSAETIDRISALVEDALTENGTDRRDILRIRLSTEEILGMWMERLDGAAVLYRTGQKFGRAYMEIWVEGVQINPDDGEDALMLSNRLLAQAGLALSYSYKNGRNCLSCNPQKKVQIGQLTQLLLAILLALGMGSVLKLMPESVRNFAGAVTQPLFQTMLGLLRAISSPMIFLAVCWGIVSIGDLDTVGKIGKKLIGRMIRGTFLAGVVFVLLASPFFKISYDTNWVAGSGFTKLYAMILEIIPTDIVSPFLEGNALQIIFMGVCIGIALLALGQRVMAVQEFVVQANEVMNYLMRMIGRCVPVFVFLSIFNLLLGSEVSYGGILKILLLAVPGCLLLCLTYIAIIAIKCRISPALLFRKLFPVFLVGLSTASSAAAFATILETCVKKLGIPKKVVNFAIPLGQVLYKPDCVISFTAIALCMAEYYHVEITVMWLLTAVLTIGLLSMAVPPIPGGTLSVYTILFAQLGIPGEAIALAVAVDSVMDFVMTATGLTCLQSEVLLTAEQVGMLQEEKLRRAPEASR